MTPHPEPRNRARRDGFAAPLITLLAASLAFSGCVSTHAHRGDCPFGCRADCPHAERQRKAEQLELGFFGALLLTGAILTLFEKDAPPATVSTPPPPVDPSSSHSTSSTDGHRLSEQTRDRIAGIDQPATAP